MTDVTVDEDVPTVNILADSTAGRTDRTVVVGGHLDSVLEGPGINDNGSGTGSILEIALQMADSASSRATGCGSPSGAQRSPG